MDAFEAAGLLLGALELDGRADDCRRLACDLDRRGGGFHRARRSGRPPTR